MAAVEHHAGNYVGNKAAIILPLTGYQHVTEELHDRAMVVKRRDDGSMNLAGLRKRVL